MDRPLILIAGGDAILTQALKSRLMDREFEIIESAQQTDILRSAQKRMPDLVIMADPQDADWQALELARQIWEQQKSTLPIIIIAHTAEERAIAALCAGFSACLKPLVPSDEPLAGTRRSRGHYGVMLTSRTRGAEDQLIGNSPAIREIKAYLPKVAATDSTVLITGETGTGKERVAELIHRYSRRQAGPFVGINCAAVPDELLEGELFGYEKGAFTGASASFAGKLRLAQGGTVFLDEVGDMNLWAQAKILRAIESREVCALGGKENVPLDIRLIAATNQDLEQLMAEKKFRQDLYYRLNVANIHLPPLRERKEDIPALFQHYFRKMNDCRPQMAADIDEAVLDSLLRYDWPGNVRELKNLIEAILIGTPIDTIRFAHLPEAFRKRLNKMEEEAPSPSERERLLATLCAVRWNKSKAAQVLRWSRMTLYRKMAKYDISRQ